MAVFRIEKTSNFAKPRVQQPSDSGQRGSSAANRYHNATAGSGAGSKLANRRKPKRPRTGKNAVSTRK